MELNKKQKQFIVVELVLLFLFISLLWLLDVSVSYLGSGHLVTLLFNLNPAVTYHLALVGLVAVFFVSLTYSIHILGESDER